MTNSKPIDLSAQRDARIFDSQMDVRIGRLNKWLANAEPYEIAMLLPIINGVTYANGSFETSFRDLLERIQKSTPTECRYHDLVQGRNSGNSRRGITDGYQLFWKSELVTIGKTPQRMRRRIARHKARARILTHDRKYMIREEERGQIQYLPRLF